MQRGHDIAICDFNEKFYVQNIWYICLPPLCAYPQYEQVQGRRKRFTFGQAGFSGEGESVEMRTNRVR